MGSGYEVAVYYFPQWHADPKNEAGKGKGWTEWPSLRSAQPRFLGHEQPKRPLWGEIDEADPRVSEMQIREAADHGITCFLYDWYWDMGGGEGPFLQRALEEGFLQAANRDRLKFALMWANHNEVSRARFDAMTDYIAAHYLGYDNYLTIDGKLYFSVYECMTLIRGLGGIEATVEAMADFRRKVREAGYADLHLNFVEWGLNPRHADIIGSDANALLARLGGNSVTSYVWLHHAELESFPGVDYASWSRQATGMWDDLQARFASVPYYPNVTMGWDPSPRCDPDLPYVRGDYPYTPVATDNTPAAFEAALREAKAYLDRMRLSPPMLTVYAWNEWTEGGYLEPDTKHGMGYLEAIRNVFHS
ncbi:glycoside hydrolase family 99-like domain-containing protein [Cohnella rhizosphaerae]|uniref:Glycoside hydrolase family 99-like domain-containing protein n=1 Tax=Cohnella rhizosphaerae TaxID=1457232 RepID=A0A9X4QTL0_9BACL|nr:glycoside hydrolase family 99-like domain-containing protein [Cohnella rhizosphaerae]MDG0810524.1 glycoside hydrolase family 99-like domain-containing protein [Cohnella rhizosphaerae]